MKGKGIAIQTILMLLVGILVVGIIVYMVYRYFLGAPLSEQECRARVTNWCSSCRVMDFGSNGVPMTESVAKCVVNYFGDAAWDNSNCDAAGHYCDCNDRGSDFTRSFCTAFTP